MTRGEGRGGVSRRRARYLGRVLTRYKYFYFPALILLVLILTLMTLGTTNL